MTEAPPPLIFGASSQVGQALLARMTREGMAAHAVSRQPQADTPPICWQQGNFHSALPATPCAVSLGPLLPFADWLRRQPSQTIERVIAVSSLSLRHKRDSVSAQERHTASLLAEGEAQLQALAEQRGIQLTVLRPAMLYGLGRDQTIAHSLRLAQRRGWMIIPVPAPGARQPLHLDDLADALLQCLRGAACGATLELGGGEVLPMQQLLQRIASSVPRCRVVRVPAWPLRQLAMLSARLSVSADGLAAALARSRQDQLPDETLTRTLLDWHPRAFEPGGGATA